MKNKKNKIPKSNGIADSTKHKSGKNESPAEPDLNRKIFIKSYEDSIRPFFSSPCLLPEIENDDVLNH